MKLNKNSKTMKLASNIKSLAVVILLSLTVRPDSQADISNWTGGEDTSWDTPGNWLPSGPPPAGNQISFADSAPDSVQTIILTGTKQLAYSTTSATLPSAYTLLFDGSGNRSYTLSGGTLQFAGTSNYQRIALGTSGTGSVTIGSAISLTGTSWLHIAGSGARTLNLNGGITGAAGQIWIINTPNARINLQQATSGLSDLFFYSGEIVAYHSAALGSTMRAYAGGTKTLSLASDVNMSGINRIYDTLQLRIREDSPASANRTISFNARLVETGTLSIVSNINSTGKVIVELKGDGSGNAGYHNSFAAESNGIIRFAQTGLLDLGLSNIGVSDGTGVISGGGSVEVTGGGTVRLGAANTYTGQTQITNGTLALHSSGSLASSRITLASSGTLSIVGLTAGAYTLGAGQTLDGSGTINATEKQLEINGTLSPGSGSTIGQITLNTGTGATAGTLLLGDTSVSEFHINGKTAGLFDQLVLIGGTPSVQSALTFGGKLQLVTDPDAGWQIGDEVAIFSWEPTTTFVTGAFGDITGLTINGALSWDVSDLYSEGVLRVIAVPEPRVWLMAAVGFAVIAFIKRHRKNRFNPNTVHLDVDKFD